MKVCGHTGNYIPIINTPLYVHICTIYVSAISVLSVLIFGILDFCVMNSNIGNHISLVLEAASYHLLYILTFFYFYYQCFCNTQQVYWFWGTGTCVQHIFIIFIPLLSFHSPSSDPHPHAKKICLFIFFDLCFTSLFYPIMIQVSHLREAR